VSFSQDFEKITIRLLLVDGLDNGDIAIALSGISEKFPKQISNARSERVIYLAIDDL